MSREEIQKLLGGYATDTLSEAERRALFEAALDDQDLFDALAKEQALRDLLRDPPARQQLLAALGPARDPFTARIWHWLRRPPVLAMVGGMAALLIVAGLVLRQPRQQLPPLAAPAPSKQFHSPAARAAQPPAPLPPPPPMPAARPPAAALAGALVSANSAPAATPAAQDSMMRFNSADGPRLGAFARAKAAVVPYTLLLRNADGAYLPVPAGTVFHAGDSVRLQVAPSEAGYIYLFQRSATAGWDLVANQRVEKGQRYELPATGGLQSDVPAQLELRLVQSRTEQAAADTPGALQITLEYR